MQILFSGLSYDRFFVELSATELDVFVRVVERARKVTGGQYSTTDPLVVSKKKVYNADISVITNRQVTDEQPALEVTEE